MLGYLTRVGIPRVVVASPRPAKLGFFIPAMLLGGLGLSHHYAARELDDFIREAEQPVFGFGWGLGLGIVAGIWIGVNFAEWFSGLRLLSEWLYRKITGGSEKPPDESSTLSGSRA